jgi:hypothetical protein
MSKAGETGMLVQQLDNAVARLAIPPTEQLAYLASIGVGGLADELALEFDDAYQPVAPLLEELEAPEELREDLTSLDQALTSDSLEWSIAAVGESDAWAEIRHLAMRIASALRAWRSE